MELLPCAPGQVRIFLTRHGKTIFNENHMAQGWCDAPLTLEGQEMARQLGRGLKSRGVRFTSAWAGELGRQRRTARLILDEMGQADIPVESEDGLMEVCFGSLEGEDEHARDVEFCKMLGIDNPREVYSVGLERLLELYCQLDKTGLAENYQQVCARIPVALERIAKTAFARGGGDVLAVTSGMISLVYFFEVLKLDRSALQSLDNLSVSILYYDGKTLRPELPLGRTDLKEVL